MRINAIRLENFRSLPDFEIDVRDNLALVGPNDSGKTSVLVGLHMLLGMAGQQLVSALTPADFGSVERDIAIEAMLVDFSDDERAAFADEISTVGGETLRCRLEASVTESDSSRCDIQRFFPDAAFTRSPSPIQLDMIGWEFISATRSLHRELGAAQSGVMRTLMSRIDLGSDLDAVTEALAALEDIVDQSASVAEFREQLAEALNAVLPGDVPPEAVRLLIPGGLSANPLVEFQVGLSEGGATRLMNEQSDGVRALTTIAAYGLAHFGANIVAIDEPEMHLHPSAQKLISQMLQNAAPQSLLATHSSHIISRVDPLNIVVVHANRPPVQVSPTAKVATFEFAARWWQDSFVQPLTAASIIAVEGPSERILVEAAAAALGVQLHQHGVHVLDLGGADQFVNAHAVFGPDGFGVKLHGLVDEDHRAEWANVLGVADADLETAGYRVSDPDLEGETVNALGVERIIELLVGG
ncbi:MAG: AAA family ATPase, partial [Acidobacteria bacterium]|nr:AAA family ATPase [Acidobacteriota bacterium]